MLDRTIFQYILSKANNETINTQGISIKGNYVFVRINDTQTLLETSNKTDKYLYLWDMDWTQTVVNHDYACSILRDPSIKIIARSASHAKVIENFCNKTPVGIVDDWNHRQLLKIIGGDNED